MKIRPLQDRVVAVRDDAEEVSSGGIIIPQAAQEKMSRGTVTAVARGRILDDGEIQPLCVSIGDKILFGKYAGSDIEIDSQELVILREDDIIGIIEGDQ
jgi:chaperonin GroES